MLFLIWTIDVVIFICLWQSKCNSNKNLRKIILFVCSQLYNLILGYYTYIMFIVLLGFNAVIFNNEILFFLALIIESLILFTLLLFPVNWIAKKESEINIIGYAITTVVAIVIGMLISYCSYSFLR